MSEEKKSSNKGRRITVISAIVILLLINAIQLYIRFTEKEEAESIIEMKDEELAKAMNTLDSIELELEYRLTVIDSLGGERDSLIIALEDIRMAKEKEVRYWRGKKREMDEMVAGYKELLIKKDKEIEDLKAQNEQLLSENQDLKQDKQNLNQTIDKLGEEKGKLEAKVELASILKTKSISLMAINSKDKEKPAKKGAFKASWVNRLRVDVLIAKNSVAKIETKDIFLRILNSSNKPLYDLAAGGGTMLLSGKEEFYTLKQDFLFDNQSPSVSFDYSKGSDWEKGNYKAEIYCEGYLIGSETFIIK